MSAYVSSHKWLVGVLLALLGVVSVVAVNVVFRDRSLVSKTSIADYIESDLGDGNGHVLTALSLVHAHAFGTPDRPFFGEHQEAPVYRILLAGAFMVFGERLLAIYILNTALFIGAILFLHAIGSRHLPSVWGVVPAGVFALYWGAASYAFHPNIELLFLFITTGFFWSLDVYTSSYRFRYLLLSALLYALMALQKPVFEYAYPLMVIVLGVYTVPKIGLRRFAVHTVIMLAVGAVVVGAWQIRNYVVVGTGQLTTGWNNVRARVESGRFSGDELRGFIVSAGAGNYITDLMIPGYASHPQPETASRERIFRRRDMKAQGLSESDTDAVFKQEAITLLKEHPIKYFLLTPIWMVRLHNPVNIHGENMDMLFVGTHDNIPSWLKVVIILGVRIVWYGAMLCAWLGVWRAAVQFRLTSLMEFFAATLMVYVTVMYASISHSEVRYILPMIPFYIYFAVRYVYYLYMKYKMPGHAV